MASTGRQATDAVKMEQALQQAPYKFGFYQALRHMECINRQKPRIGLSSRPVDDVLRLGQEPSVSFAPATLASYEPVGDNGKSKLSVNFFGMFGPNGPLPLHLTEYARDRMRNSDDLSFSEFMDIFHHRMLSFFYRAWANAQPTVNFDRPEQDRFSLYIGSLFGLGMQSMRHRDELPDLTKIHFAGRLSMQTRNAEGLVAMIRSFFNIPADIEQFIGEWMKLPLDCRCQLGITPLTGTLGKNATLGEHVWGCQQKFRVVLGPLSFKDYVRMLPGKPSGRRLRALVRNYIGDSMNWDVNLVLKKDHVRPMQLGKDDLLGWNTWLGRRTSDEDVHDLVLEPMKMIA